MIIFKNVPNLSSSPLSPVISCYSLSSSLWFSLTDLQAIPWTCQHTPSLGLCTSVPHAWNIRPLDLLGYSLISFKCQFKYHFIREIYILTNHLSHSFPYYALPFLCNSYHITHFGGYFFIAMFPHLKIYSKEQRLCFLFCLLINLQKLE